jgi:hypothetical protein
MLEERAPGSYLIGSSEDSQAEVEAEFRESNVASVDTLLLFRKYEHIMKFS